MRRLLCALALIALMSSAGCGVDKDKGIFMAAGSYGDLAVVMPDDDSRPLVDRFLGRFNDSHIFVIQEERTFVPDVYEPKQWDLAKGYKNALLLVVLGQDGPVSKAAHKVVSDESWQRMEESGGGIVQINDPWSTYQLVVVVAARDRNSLGSVLMQNAESLRAIFEKSNRERILRRHRYEGLNEPLMNTLWERFGFFLEVPATFTVNQSEPDGFPAVEIMRNGPSRGLTVSWQEMADPESALQDRDRLLAMRADMGTAVHDEEIVPETLVWESAEIGGVACLRLEGAWNSTRFTGGGPFWSYFIPDPQRNRMFCVDMLVFAPGMDKMVLFRRLDAVASTFSTRRPRG